MRLLALVVVAVLVPAAPAAAQVLWLGAGAATTWEYQAEAAPGEDFLHGDDLAPMAFVAWHIDDDTMLRLRALDMPRTTGIDGDGWDGNLQALTLGVDYLMGTGPIGEAVFSGGIGAYRLELEAEGPPEDVGGTKFGYYVGVAEWFHLTRRSRAVIELTADRSSHRGTPLIFGVSAGVAFSF